ncbi:hypothetical protein D3C80_2000440 [compost metagenome]
MAATQRRDNAHRHRLADAERVADGQHHVTDLYVLEPAQRDRGQVLERHFQHGQVGFRVGAHHLGVGLAAVGQRDLDFIGAVDHVVVG